MPAAAHVWVLVSRSTSSGLPPASRPMLSRRLLKSRQVPPLQDESNEQMIVELFRELHREGHTIIMVAHDRDIARLADRRVRLEHGPLEASLASHTHASMPPPALHEMPAGSLQTA